MKRDNPCVTCGACCAHFRVSFYWAEADDAPTGSVPVALTEDLNGLMRCMKGTNQREPRCAALVGCVGESVRCAIYEQRPTACREFGVKWSRGALHFSADELERCNQARAAWGLPPLFDDTSGSHPEPESSPPAVPPHARRPAC
ncbi:MAG: YkgJ family cysteine cluster protein [Chloroflexi bacterium]|nr:YkgJ family cysteine cluster protein [Chloroflexota bacterium]